jgi:hypothetical protein
MPVEAAARIESREASSSSMSRLSSFGFSGTIAHGAFAGLAGAQLSCNGRSLSLYRASVLLGAPHALRLHMRRESTTTFHLPSSGMPLSPAADAAIAEHVVGGGVLLPGVGYLEMAMASSRAS